MTRQVTIIRRRALQIEMSQIVGPVEAAHITVTHSCISEVRENRNFITIQNGSYFTLCIKVHYFQCL
jgi:hypothetical protein